MINSESAKRTTRFRPRSSASEEAKGSTRRAKREVHDVMTDLSSEVKGREERDVPMETRVALITPVSSGLGEECQYLCVLFDRVGRYHWIGSNVHPNSRPLIPAEKVSNQMKRPGGDMCCFPDRESCACSISWLSSCRSPSVDWEFAIKGSSGLSVMMPCRCCGYTMELDVAGWDPFGRK